jgi:hypothetical protein
MLNRLAVGALAAAVVLGAAAPVSAQVVQSVGVNLGALMPRGEDARVENDVWLKNLPVYRFEIKDFTGAEVGGEWNAAFGNHVEVGLATSFYQRTVHTNYRDFVDKDFTEIESDFKLRTIPVSGVVRFLPFGKVGSFQPYVGVSSSISTTTTTSIARVTLRRAPMRGRWCSADSARRSVATSTDSRSSTGISSDRAT